MPTTRWSPTLGHQTISLLLAGWLLRHAPAGLCVAQAVGVRLGDDTCRQPATA